MSMEQRCVESVSVTAVRQMQRKKGDLSELRNTGKEALLKCLADLL